MAVMNHPIATFISIATLASHDALVSRSLVVSIANESPIEVGYAFCRVKFDIWAQKGYFQLKLWLHFRIDCMRNTSIANNTLDR